jgi:hypothetical protein
LVRTAAAPAAASAAAAATLTRIPARAAANMASGAIAGAAVETALYPIDTIKTRLQAVRGGGAIVWGGLYSGLAGKFREVKAAPAPRGQYCEAAVSARFSNRLASLACAGAALFLCARALSHSALFRVSTGGAAVSALALVALVLLAAVAEALVLVAVAIIARTVSVAHHVRSHVVVVVATWTSCSRSSVPTTPQVMPRFQKAPSSSSAEYRHKSLRQN